MMITHCNSIKEESTLRNQSAQQGFTLLELAVAMAVSAVVLLGIYASQTLQQDTFRNQTMVVDAQQNLR
jgi:prepilin-type N-terminal cleavage/methylation domain-containing protein